MQVVADVNTCRCIEKVNVSICGRSPDRAPPHHVEIGDGSLGAGIGCESLALAS